MSARGVVLAVLLAGCARSESTYHAEWCARFCAPPTRSDCALECEAVEDAGVESDGGDSTDAGLDGGVDAGEGLDAGLEVDAGNEPRLSFVLLDGGTQFSAGVCEIVVAKLEGPIASETLTVTANAPIFLVGGCSGLQVDSADVWNGKRLGLRSDEIGYKKLFGSFGQVSVGARLAFNARMNLQLPAVTGGCQGYSLRLTALVDVTRPVSSAFPIVLDAGITFYTTSSCTTSGPPQIPADGGSAYFYSRVARFLTGFTLTAPAFVAPLSYKQLVVGNSFPTCSSGGDCETNSCSGGLCSCAARDWGCSANFVCCSGVCDLSLGKCQ